MGEEGGGDVLSRQLQFPTGYNKDHYWVTNPKGHIWQEEDYSTPGEIYLDSFAGVSHGTHNGPKCVNCGLAFCVHCVREVPGVCPKPPGTKGARRTGRVLPEVPSESINAIIEEIEKIASIIGPEDEYTNPDDWQQRLWDENGSDAYRMGKEQGERELARKILKSLRE